jgi:hypothetical protein
MTNKKYKRNSVVFEMLDVLFGGLEASPLQRHSWRTQEKNKLLKFFNLCHKKPDTDPIHMFLPVLQIHDILGWIRIRGSIPLTNESGSGFGSESWIRILLFSSLTFKMPAKN